MAWADLITDSEQLTLFQQPQLDILTYFPNRDRLSEIDQVSAYVLNAGMNRAPKESIFVATYTVDGAALAARGHRVQADVTHGRILRSVLMKPETETHVPALHREILVLTASAGTAG